MTAPASMPEADVIAAVLSAPVPGVIPAPPSPFGVAGSTSMWNSIAASMRARKPLPVVEAMLPRTLPVVLMDDLAPYHFVAGRGSLSLRKGAAPKAVAAAASDFAEGKVGLNDFLDRIGVPKARP